MRGEIALALAVGLSILFGAFLIAYKPMVYIVVKDESKAKPVMLASVDKNFVDPYPASCVRTYNRLPGPECLRP